MYRSAYMLLEEAESGSVGKGRQRCLSLGDQDHHRCSPMTNPPERQRTEEEESLQIRADFLLESGKIEEAESLYDHALDYYEKALTIYRRLDLAKGMVQALVNMAQIQINKGDIKESIHALQLALEITRDRNLILLQGRVLCGLGGRYQAMGELGRAMDHHRRALKISREIGDRRYEGISSSNIAIVHHQLGENDKAIRFYNEALVINREIGDRKNEGMNTGNLGKLHQVAGNHDRAMDLYRKALLISREIGNRRGEAANLGNLGVLLHLTNQQEAAVSPLQQAIEICDDIGFRVGAGAFRGSLSLIQAERGRQGEALPLIEEGEPQVEVYPLEHGLFLCRKAQVHHIANQSGSAHQALAQAEQIATEIDAQEDSELARMIKKTHLIIEGAP